ncbi:MAG: nucleotidyltransferase domain-containing protein, partial [Proteobacteria bacterium]|nr:nucleotidyltransferase domain-containing protein [Pseudomonadota bacterium]
LVLGTVGFAALVQALFPLHAALGREINPVLYTPQEFADRAKRSDAFARDVLTKPKLFIKGEEHELAELAGDRTPARTHA